MYTSDLLVEGHYATVLALGDNQYDSGSLSDYQAYFSPTWGRVEALHQARPREPRVRDRWSGRLLRLLRPAAYHAFWRDLYAAGADVVLNGHEQNYERFALQNPSGVADPLGIGEFVVGTGGNSHYGFGSPIANSQVRNSDTFGILKLTLGPTSYQWQFVPEGGKSFTDRGSRPCH